MDARCDRCGWAAPAEAGYRSRRRWLVLRRVTECPRCRARRRERRHRILGGVLAWGLPLAVFFCSVAATLLVAPARHLLGFIVWLALSPLLFVGALYPLVVAHELGHALTAWLLGLRLFRITFAEGPVIWRRTVAGVAIEVGAHWYHYPSGWAQFAHTGTRWLRLKHFLVVLGGPFANVVLLAAAVGVYFAGPAGGVRWAAGAVAAANALLLVSSLMPLSIKLNGVASPSDGLQLLFTPFLSRQTVRTLHAQSCAAHGDEELRAERPREALAWYRRGLEASPDDPTCTYGVGLALFRSGDRDEALAYCRETVLTHEHHPPIVRALLADVGGTAVLHLLMQPDRSAERGELLRCGEELCLLSQAQLPADNPETKASCDGTLACVLIEQGRHDEGVPLLRAALAVLDDPLGRAYGFAYLALAAARSGDAAQAAAHLEEAARIDADHPAVRYARAGVSAALTPPDATLPGPR